MYDDWTLGFTDLSALDDETFVVMERLQRRIRRLRKLADGYRERHRECDVVFTNAAIEYSNWAKDTANKATVRERSRIVNRLRMASNISMDGGDKATGRYISEIADEIERGEL